MFSSNLIPKPTRATDAPPKLRSSGPAAALSVLLSTHGAAAQEPLQSSASAPDVEAPASPAAAYAPAPSPLRLIDISFDLLGAFGASTAPEAELSRLQAGGHDPKNQGFTVQNVELTFAGVVDPYVRGDSHIVLLIDESGETVVELEEAYLTSLDLPLNLQLKAGQFFTAFGRLNATHPHAWDFVDQPVVNSRFFGPDGLRSPGVQLSWLTPLPFFAELFVSVQNAQGETVTSFGSVPDETFAGRVLLDRDVRGPADLLYLSRLRASVDPSEETTVVIGASALFGPNASATRARTAIYGADLYVKWKPLMSDRGWPFVALQSEANLRRYEAGEVVDADAVVEAPQTLDDLGLYSQLLVGFARPWVVGIRYDGATAEPTAFTLADQSYQSASDSLRDRRQRYSAVLTYYPSEFSKLRVQYNHDRAQFLTAGAAHGVYCQFEILFGAHGAHKF